MRLNLSIHVTNSDPEILRLQMAQSRYHFIDFGPTLVGSIYILGVLGKSLQNR